MNLITNLSSMEFILKKLAKIIHFLIKATLSWIKMIAHIIKIIPEIITLI